MLRLRGSVGAQQKWSRAALRPYREYSSVSQQYKVGDKLHGYSVQEVRNVPELQLLATRLSHEATGAQHLHVTRDDSNNVFAVGFSTPVTDSTGVPHILEHTTLCGSQKYPVRDPFFKMLNRSLATFMNAFTASDYTIYPFATTNEVDYKNLRDVYMDSAFHPQLRRLDFLQEGWRLEHEDPLDPKSPIVFKGVVYNEMKGQMSDPGYLFYQRAHQHMFPGTTYQNVSGGDPRNITDLTHEQLVKFHHSHYHPSNAKFFTYGNFPLEEQLQSLDAKLAAFKRIDVEEVNKRVTPWDAPRRVKMACPPDPMSNPDRQTKLSISYLANDAQDHFTSFAMRLLSYFLLDGHSSPMYKALIETNLGSDFSPNTGYDPSTGSTCLSIGLQGVRSADVPRVEETIKQVLQDVKRDGIEPKRIEAAIHQMELSQKHKTADFGLSIMHTISSSWFNGSNPIDSLEINKMIERLKSELAKGGLFESSIEKYLLSNPHQLTFIMEPEESFSANLIADEQARLKHKLSQLNAADEKRIYDDGLELLKNQDQTEELSCLPTLTMQDIAPTTKHVSLDHTGIGETPVQWRTTSTNGITYFRAISAWDHVPEELKLYVPLFCDAITSLGTKKRTMQEIDDDVRLYTGGLRVAPFLSTNHSDIDQIEEGISLSGNCLDRNIPKMYSLLSEIIHETDFDNVSKLKTLIMGNASGLVNSVAESGHVFARTIAESSLTPSRAASEVYGGMTQVDFMSKLAETEDLSDVIAKLKAIAAIALKKSSIRAAVTCGEESVQANEETLTQFLSGLSTQSPSQPSPNVFTPHYTKMFYPLPFSVNYTAQVVRGVPYTHSDGAKLALLSSLVTTHFLHREIREKGGAYGGGSRYGGLNGTFSFYSYRDPRNVETLDTFQRALDWVMSRSFSERELTEAKLSLFQGIDAPLSVAEEGLINFSDGINEDMRQRRREQLLMVNEQDVKEAADKYLVSAFKDGKTSMAVLGVDTPKISSASGWDIKRFGALNNGAGGEPIAANAM
ncbi:hypothetical protein BZG36_00782 [Bifiguratus adelaidae]|uniref:Presequence protease, mitochondrial n=1 Tax=Bifiguratus adelaidae TaxID=1938954 RepID=A0A261Y6M7_9FUNG|nr:hypothetical protein BZG36_00782 [Bifiguratus adelaidae]